MFLVVEISKKQGKYEVLIGWVGISLRQKLYTINRAATGT